MKGLLRYAETAAAVRALFTAAAAAAAAEAGLGLEAGRDGVVDDDEPTVRVPRLGDVGASVGIWA